MVRLQGTPNHADAFTDTPFFQHAGNFSTWTVRAAPPVYALEKVAKTVVLLVTNPRAEVVIGGFGKVISVLKPLLPAGLGTWLNSSPCAAAMASLAAGARATTTAACP